MRILSPLAEQSFRVPEMQTMVPVSRDMTASVNRFWSEIDSCLAFDLMMRL